MTATIQSVSQLSGSRYHDFKRQQIGHESDYHNKLQRVKKMSSVIVNMETIISIYVITIIFNIFMYKFYCFR